MITGDAVCVQVVRKWPEEKIADSFKLKFLNSF